MNQKMVFLEGEGNSYYERNLGYYSNQEISKLYKLYADYLKKDMKVLEVGCCNGINLNYYQNSKNCKAYGIDPSVEAIKNGRLLFPKLELSVGTADELLFEDDFFDMVVFGSSLHWVDRTLLSKVVYETDRVLKNHGFIGISDFDVKIPQKTLYKHLEGVYTYKCDHASIFTAFPHFALIEKISKKFENNELPFSEDLYERFSSSVIYKNHEQGYMTI